MASEPLPATTGSAGLDLASRESITIVTPSVHLVPTGVWGPLGDNINTLLIGHSSTTKLGLLVLPRVIDSDYEGETQVMLWTPVHLCFIPAGQRLAQLIPFSNKTPKGKGQRGTNNFGSTGQPQIFWTSSVTTAQPTLTCTIDGKKFKGLVDTGADVSIIKSNEWPSDWPTISPTSTLIRVGGMQQTRQSSDLRLVLGPDGQTAQVAPFVASMPCTSWGRDVLGQFGTIIPINLTSP